LFARCPFFILSLPAAEYDDASSGVDDEAYQTMKAEPTSAASSPEHSAHLAALNRLSHMTTIQVAEHLHTISHHLLETALVYAHCHQ
jgi:hypothetical protein